MQLAWLAGVSVVAAIVAFIVLNAIRDNHTIDGNEPITQEYADCLVSTIGDPDRDEADCQPEIPWYAERPLPYAALIGLGVFLLGGFAIIVNGQSRGR